MAGIGFLIAMLGVPSCLLGGLYFLFRDDHPSDEAKKRRKRLLVSYWKYLLFVIRAGNLRSSGSPDAPGRSQACNLDVGEALVGGAIHGGPRWHVSNRTIDARAVRDAKSSLP